VSDRQAVEIGKEADRYRFNAGTSFPGVALTNEALTCRIETAGFRVLEQ
jgi:hypothetical protein